MQLDLRTQRSESVEGKRRARRAWEAYRAAMNRVGPLWVDEGMYDLPRRYTADLLGFWLAWHLYGGFQGLKLAGWHERTIYRRLKAFRLAFDEHPDTLELVGVGLDREAFWGAYLTRPGTEG